MVSTFERELPLIHTGRYRFTYSYYQIMFLCGADLNLRFIMIKTKHPLRLSTLAVLLATCAAVPIVANAGAVEFSFSGQVSRALTFADNGVDDDTLFVDNNNSGTRLRLKG